MAGSSIQRSLQEAMLDDKYHNHIESPGQLDAIISIKRSTAHLVSRLG